MLLSQVASVLGLDMGLRAYPGGSPLRDAGHLRLLHRLRARLGDGGWTYDVPFPIAGDLRAWDAVRRVGNARVAFEAEVRLVDIQALIRRVLLKKRDGGVDRLVMVVADTRSNRAAVREAEDILRSVFPVPARIAMDALARGIDPGGDALILI